MKHTAIDFATSQSPADLTALSDTERQEIAAKLILRNGYRCGRVLAVLPTGTAEIWHVSGMQDGAMDALVTFQMDARTGIISRG